MEKELPQMSLEELWELFPIFLVAHDDRWDLFYSENESALKNILSDCPIGRISHIGSTAISGIWAKNIVDVLIEVSEDSDIENTAKVIENSGFIRMSMAANRISFNRGYTAKGFADKVYHVHLRYAGDNDELYFRDYLNEHKQGTDNLLFIAHVKAEIKYAPVAKLAYAIDFGSVTLVELLLWRKVRSKNLIDKSKVIIGELICLIRYLTKKK